MQSGTAQPEDLRSRRRRLVQDDIARIAVRLFLDRGYDAVSVEEIAAAAGMSERSFFRYFATKDEVLRRFRRSVLIDVVRRFEQRPEEEPPAVALRNAYVASSHVPVARRRRIHDLGHLLTKASGVWARELGELVSDESVIPELARRLGAQPDDLRPAVYAAAVSAAVTVGWYRWLRTGGAEDPAPLVGAAIDLLALPR